VQSGLASCKQGLTDIFKPNVQPTTIPRSVLRTSAEDATQAYPRMPEIILPEYISSAGDFDDMSSITQEIERIEIDPVAWGGFCDLCVGNHRTKGKVAMKRPRLAPNEADRIRVRITFPLDKLNKALMDNFAALSQGGGPMVYASARSHSAVPGSC